MALKLIKKMEALTSTSTLELSVSKNATAATAVEVGSTGDDDESFTDKELTPGPAAMPLNPKNSYNIVWSGAFVTKGSVTLRVKVLNASGDVTGNKNVTVNGEAEDKFFRLVMIP